MKFNLGLGLGLLGLALVGCGDHASDSGTTGSTGKTAANSPPKLSKLITDDIKVGSGPAAEVGDTVFVQYRGTLANGSQFDANVPADPANPDKPPFSFQLQPDRTTVIQGWNKGILGMKIGGERKLSIPSNLAYGEKGHGSIGPNTDLYFDVTLLGILKQGQEGNYGVSDLKKGTGPAVKGTETSGDWVTITYKAELVNHMPVGDSSKLKDGTLQFQAGTGEMGGGEFVAIKGIVAGVVGMQVGGERLLTCPPNLAMNTTGPPSPGIPAGSIVCFDVKLLRVLDKKGPPIKAPTSKPPATKSPTS